MLKKGHEEETLRYRHLRSWMHKWSVDDSWYVFANNQVYGPFPVMEVERRAHLLPAKKLHVMHASYAAAQDNTSNWLEMHATPKELDKTDNIDLSKFKITSKINRANLADYAKRR